MKIFKEEQRFTQTWLIVIVLSSLVIPMLVITNDFIKNEGMSFISYLLTMVFILIAGGFIFIFKLKTRIDEVGLHYQFFPIHLKFKSIPWTNIQNAYVRQYNPISEYGGWGIKGGGFLNKKRGRAINIKGDVGIQLEMNDGKKIVIGTQLKTQAEHALLTYKNKYKAIKV